MSILGVGKGQASASALLDGAVICEVAVHIRFKTYSNFVSKLYFLNA